MPIFTSWVHGNGLTIETPVMYNADGQAAERLILTPAGPGAWVEPEREGVGAVSWLHLPIPIGGISQLERADLLRVFLLFRVWVFAVISGSLDESGSTVANAGDGNLDLSTHCYSALEPA